MAGSDKILSGSLCRLLVKWLSYYMASHTSITEFRQTHDRQNTHTFTSNPSKPQSPTESYEERLGFLSLIVDVRESERRIYTGVMLSWMIFFVTAKPYRTDGYW